MVKIFFTLLILISVQMKLKSQVTQEWVSRYSPSIGIYNVAGPEIDNSGNVFVAGSVNVATLTDYVTIKYNSAGAEQWSRIFTGPIEDRVIDMKLDHSGNVCVTGLSENTTGTYDIITIKYSTDGDSLWVRRFNGATAFTMDQPVAIETDVNDNVYVLGYSFGTSPMTLVTIKYNSQGDSLWVARYLTGGTDLPRDIFVDDTGNVYVYARGLRIIKYNSNGIELWNRTYPYDAAESDKVLTGDAAGNIYFAAEKNTSTFDDFAVVKLNSSGDIIWSDVRNGFGGLTSTHDYARAICIDGNNNVFITGEIYDLGVINFSTLKYNSSGIFQWEKNFSDPQNGEGGNDIVCDAGGNVYVTGGSNDYATIKYNTNGDSQWVMRYNGPSNMNDLSSSAAIDNSGNVYITGRSRFNQNPSYYEIATIKYSQTINIISSEAIANKDFKLYQNFPNPFNPKTIINYHISTLNLVSLKVYDIRGNEVVVLVNERQNAGNYSVTFDGSDLASGIYFYKLEIGSEESYTGTKKMILMK